MTPRLYQMLALILDLVLLMAVIYVFTYPNYNATQVECRRSFAIVYVGVMLSYVYQNLCWTADLPWYG